MRENAAVADTFASRFAMARSGPGPLVWGLDPSSAQLRAWGWDRGAVMELWQLDVTVSARSDGAPLFGP